MLNNIKYSKYFSLEGNKDTNTLKINNTNTPLKDFAKIAHPLTEIIKR